MNENQKHVRKNIISTTMKENVKEIKTCKIQSYKSIYEGLLNIINQLPA